MITEYLAPGKGGFMSLNSNAYWLLEPCNDGLPKKYSKALCAWKFRMQSTSEGKENLRRSPKFFQTLCL